MRTTVDIDDNLLAALREMARDRRVSMGRVISDLVGHALRQGAMAGSASAEGLPQFPMQPGAAVVTLEVVNRLRDDLD